MSLSKPLRQQSARASRNTSATKMKLSSPQAKNLKSKNQASYHNSPSALKQPHPDSGFFENADSDLEHTPDETLPSYGNSNEDWVLFANEDVTADDGYFFTDEDEIDIASVKAIHGSVVNGRYDNKHKDNHPFLSSMSYENGRFKVNVANRNSRRPEPPIHNFTDSHSTTPGLTTLQQWVRTHEQHEELAWFFEQPPHSPFRTQHCQQAWNEDIDLTIYEIRN